MSDVEIDETDIVLKKLINSETTKNSSVTAGEQLDDEFYGDAR